MTENITLPLLISIIILEIYHFTFPSISINSDVFYNIVNGPVAPNEVSVSDAVLIGGTFILQSPSIWIPCQDFQSSEDDGVA